MGPPDFFSCLDLDDELARCPLEDLRAWCRLERLEFRPNSNQHQLRALIRNFVLERQNRQGQNSQQNVGQATTSSTDAQTQNTQQIVSQTTSSSANPQIPNPLARSTTQFSSPPIPPITGHDPNLSPILLQQSSAITNSPQQISNQQSANLGNFNGQANQNSQNSNNLNQVSHSSNNLSSQMNQQSFSNAQQNSASLPVNTVQQQTLNSNPADLTQLASLLQSAATLIQNLSSTVPGTNNNNSFQQTTPVPQIAATQNLAINPQANLSNSAINYPNYAAIYQNLQNPYGQQYPYYVNPLCLQQPLLPPPPQPRQMVQPPNLPQNQNLDLTILDSVNQPTLTFTPDIRRSTSIAVALQKKKLSFSGKAGSDPTRFLRQLQESMDSLGITGDEILKNLTSVLSGEALEWFRLKQNSFNSYDHFKGVFKKQYTVANYQERLHEEIEARKQAKNEPITTFLTNMQILFDKLEPPYDLERQLNITFKKLNPDYLSQIDRSDFNDFESFLTKGKSVEFKLLHMKQYKNPNPVENPLVTQAAWRANEKSDKKKSPTKREKASAAIEETAAAQHAQKNKKSPKSPNKESSAKKMDTKNVADIFKEDLPPQNTCFKCRKENHSFKDCTNEGLKYFCYSCGRKNVVIKRCTTQGCKEKWENRQRDRS